MQTDIRQSIKKSMDMLQRINMDSEFISSVEKIVDTCVDALNSGNKLLFMGNGGSAADAQHLAAELVSRFEFDRPGLTAFALTTDTSALTAIGNDYGFERLFSRQVEAVGKENDIIFGISTSGNSSNVLIGLEAAQRLNLVTIGLTGSKKGDITKLVDHLIEIPSTNTANIQEGHIVIGHIICGLIERRLFTKD